MTLFLKQQPVDCIIFDIDGTLIDSNDAHTRSWMMALKEAGFEKNYGEVRKLIGMGGDKLLPILTGISDEDPRGERISERRGTIFREQFLPALRAFPGTRDLLCFLKENDILFGIATSASVKDLKGLLKQVKIDDIFGDRKTSADDAENSKPDPDIVVATLKKLSAPQGRTVMIGDTPYDIEAARRAGIPCVAVRCGGYWKDADFRKALAIYENPAEILALLQRAKTEWDQTRASSADFSATSSSTSL